MTQRLRAAWLVGLGLVVALALTGSPRAGPIVAGQAAPCACDGLAGNAGCPATCSDACCHMAPAVVEDSREFGAIAAAPERFSSDEASPPAAPPADGVFHPPTS